MDYTNNRDYTSRYTGPEIDARLKLAGEAYQKPATGIPASDLAEAVQTDLAKAGTAVQPATLIDVPSNGYLKIRYDGSAGVYQIEAIVDRVNVVTLAYVIISEEEYTKVIYLSEGWAEAYKDSDNSIYLYWEDGIECYVTPVIGGIEAVSAVRDLPGDAEAFTPTIYYEKPDDGIPASDLEEDVQTSLGKADTAYQKPSTGIPASDLASGVQTSLGKADTSVQPAALQAVTDLIPAQASSSNQLADKNFVNSSIQTETATFRGNWDTYDDIPTDVTGLPGEAADNNDYLVVRDASGYAPKWTAEKEDGYSVGDIVYDNGDGRLHVCIQAVNYPEPEEAESPETDTEHWAVTTSNPAYEGTWRYKYVPQGSSYNKYNWHPEYQVNEKPLTAAQLAALNSGITAQKVSKLDALPTRAELTQEEALKEDKSNKVTSLSSQSTDTQYPSAKCVYDIVGDVESLINAL